MFRNNTQQNNKAGSPSVLINKPCLSRSLHCSHPDSSPLLWDSHQTVCKTNVFGSNEALGHFLHPFRCFSDIDTFIAAQSFLSQSALPSCSHFSSFSFFLFFFKIPFPCIDFLPLLVSCGIFLSFF